MKMPKFLKAMKVVVVNSLIFSLLQNPFISNAMAAEKSAVDVQDIMKIAGGAVDLYGKFLGQKQAMIQAQIASARNQQLMAQLSPNCRKPDGTACYVTQAKYFPECNLPASMSNMPQNVCSANTQDPNAIGSMITYESIAKGWKNYYDQMSNRNSNASYPTGVRCLLDKQKAMDSQLTEMMNNLQRLQDKLNQDKQVFRDNNKKLLEEMNTTNDELFGSTKSNLALKTRDFAKYFSQSCQGVLGKELANGNTKGLNGMLQGLSAPNKSAVDFQMNKGSIESDIRREAEKLAASIKTNGVDDFNELAKNNKIAPENNATFGVYGQSMLSQVAKNVSEFEVAKARIKKDLGGVKNYDLPPLDSRFSSNMDEFLSSANETFKRQFIGDCVTGADKGIAIPVDDILRSLEQRATNSEGTARDDYRIALQRILKSGDSSESILAQIKELDQNYPGMTVTYKDANQNRVIETPYSLFMKTAEKCEQKYVQGDNKKVERARAALAELKTLNDSYASKVSNAVLSQLLTCNGSSMKAGSCNEEALSGGQNNPNFCVAHASQCASEIQGCYAEVNTHVQTRKAKMDNLAKKFNDNVAAMVARSNALYEQQKAAVTNITKVIQQRFPGTNFEIPKDMFVSMPELKKDAYGVEMAGDGKIESFLEGPTSMPDKISLLKEMFKRQKETVGKELTEYISGQESAMATNAQKWESLAGECKTAIDGATNNIAKANAENAKKQGEVDNLVAKYCTKYSNLKENPNGGCDQAKELTDIMDKIIDKGGDGRIVNRSASLASQYDSACRASNNEGTEMPPECDGEEKPSLKEYCAAARKKFANSMKGSGSSAAAPAVPLLRLCDGNTDNKAFFAALSAKVAKADASKVSSATSMADLFKIKGDLSDSTLSFLGAVDSLMDGSNGKICEKLLSASKVDTSGVENQFKGKVASLKTDSQEYKDAVAEKDKIVSSLKEKKKVLDDALLALGSANSAPEPSGPSAQKLRLTKLGEKFDEETACDAQNSTGTMAKSMPWMTDPSSFDNKVLGNNSTR